MIKLNNCKSRRSINGKNISDFLDDTNINIFAPDISAALVCMDIVPVQEEEKAALLDLYQECIKRMSETEYVNPYFETELKNVRPIINYFRRLPFTVEFYLCEKE